MTRLILILILYSVCALCMEMKETVERMVMVRTTGSDLQPAATGYIYKKESDGEASVVKMDESEIMEQLSKYYEKPESYKAPPTVAASPFYAKEDDGNKAASHASEAYVIPVEEKVDEGKGDGHYDDIVDHYKDFLEKYSADFGDYKGDFNDYLHGLKQYQDGNYNEKGGGNDYDSKGHHEYGDKGYKGYGTKHHFDKGGAGDYHKEYHTGFSVSKKGGGEKHYDEKDNHGKHYGEGHGYKGGDHGFKTSNSKGEEVDGFHKVYNKNEIKKDHDFYDSAGVKGGFNKHGDGHTHHGSDAGKFKKGGSHESGNGEAGFRKEGSYIKQSGEKHGEGSAGESSKESSFHDAGKLGSEEGKFDGKGYGYEIKH